MDRVNETKKYVLSFALLTALLIALSAVNLYLGSVNISLSDVTDVFLGRCTDRITYNIIRDIRFPRVVSAVLLGGSLSVSGFLLQTFFGNPVAGPFVLGISSGAKLVVASAMILFVNSGVLIGNAQLVLASFIGSMITMGLVLMMSGKVRNMSMLIVSGVMIGYICSAVTDIVVNFAEDSNIVNLHNWSLGSFSGIDNNDVKYIFFITVPAFIVTFALSKPMTAYQLGEEHAESLGVNVRLFRFMIIVLSGILSACVTAFAGPVSFVGIAVPQLVRGIMKTSRPIVIIPACFLGGGIFCLFCDLIARTIFSPTELSISSVTAVFGAPVVIWLMLKRSRNR